MTDKPKYEYGTPNEGPTLEESLNTKEELACVEYVEKTILNKDYKQENIVYEVQSAYLAGYAACKERAQGLEEALKIIASDDKWILGKYCSGGEYFEMTERDIGIYALSKLKKERGGL
jgi:hypothetical protein